MGAEAYRQVWGRSGQGDDCRGVGWRGIGDVACSGAERRAGDQFVQECEYQNVCEWSWFRTKRVTDMGQIIAASPWVPTQPYYDDAISIRHYSDFASAAGCSSREGVFDCLVSKDSLTLQRAANKVSTSAPTPRGNWLVLGQGRMFNLDSSNYSRAFIPVTDGSYVTGPPSTQLARGKLNGLRLLVGVSSYFTNPLNSVTYLIENYKLTTTRTTQTKAP